MAFSNQTVAQPAQQFVGIGAVSDPASIVVSFLPTLEEDRVLYLSETEYLTLSDTPGLPR